MPAFKDVIERLSPLNDVYDFLSTDAPIKILTRALPAAFDLDHWESISLTESICIYHNIDPTFPSHLSKGFHSLPLPQNLARYPTSLSSSTHRPSPAMPS